MTSKERVLSALHHREPDRVPVDLWALPPVTYHLRNHFQVTSDEAVWTALGVDLRSIWPRYIGPSHQAFPDGSWKDWWGIKKKMVGSFEEIAGYPLAGAETVADVMAYNWPDPDWFDYRGLKAQCGQMKDFALVIRDPGPYTTCVLRVAMYLRSMERLMIDLKLNPEIARVLLDRISRFYLDMSRRILDSVADQTDIYLIADDIGMQDGLMISPDIFTEFIEPHLVQFIGLAKEYGQAVMYHSCGAIKPMIPRLIELGIDILNPIQVSAQGMNAELLKEEFGAKLVLHGALDVQTIIATGSPSKIKTEVASLCGKLGRGGGFVLAPTNNIPPETPLKNILAIYEAAAT